MRQDGTRIRRRGARRSRRGSGRAMAAAARRAASPRRHPPRPAPPAARPAARRGGRGPSPAGRRARAPAACATGPAESGPAPWPSPRPRRRCGSDQRRSSGTRRRRAGSRARDGRRRPRPPPRRPSSRDDHRRRHGFTACHCAADRVRVPGGLVHHTGRALPRPAGPRHVDREVQAARRRGRSPRRDRDCRPDDVGRALSRMTRLCSNRPAARRTTLGLCLDAPEAAGGIRSLGVRIGMRYGA